MHNLTKGPKMKPATINKKVRQLYECGRLEFGQLQLIGYPDSEDLDRKDKLLFTCCKCGSEYCKSLDNLRAIKKSAKGVGCQMCKKVSETDALIAPYLAGYGVEIKYLPLKAGENSVMCQLAAYAPGLASIFKFGTPVEIIYLRKLVRANKKPPFFHVLEQLKNSIFPFIEVLQKVHKDIVYEYGGYFNKTANPLGNHLFKFFRVSSSVLHRYPNGYCEENISALKLNKQLIVQHGKDVKTYDRFQKGLREYGGKDGVCLGRVGDVYPDQKRPSELIFSYVDAKGFPHNHTCRRAFETDFGKRFNKTEALAFIIMNEIFPDGQWRRNTRPKWNTAPKFSDRTKTVRLEIDILSEVYKIAVEVQSNYHTGKEWKTRDEKSAAKTLYYDKCKKQLCIKNEFKHMEIWARKPNVGEMCKEVSEKLDVKISSEQKKRIKGIWLAVTKNEYLLFQNELKAVLDELQWKLISPLSFSDVRPMDSITVSELPGKEASYRANYCLKKGKERILALALKS